MSRWASAAVAALATGVISACGSNATLGKPLALAQFESLQLGESRAQVTKQFGQPESRQKVVGTASRTRNPRTSTASTTGGDIPTAVIRGAAATRFSFASKDRDSGASGHTSRPVPSPSVSPLGQAGTSGLRHRCCDSINPTRRPSRTRRRG